MKLQIRQTILEKAQFVHVAPDFLGKEATPAGPHGVGFQVEMMDVQEPGRSVVRLTVKSEEGAEYAFTASYLIVIDYEREGAPADLNHRLAVTGATMLMPMLRELVGNLTMRGRFGPIWLPPINFSEALAEEPTPKAKRGRTRKKADATSR